jgi:hypothetical protein
MSTTDVAAWATATLAAVAALALAANVWLAFLTKRVAKATERAAEATATAAKATEVAAEATREEAEATREEAKASLRTIEEMKTDRALRGRPHLRWHPGADAWVEGANYGAGRALNSIFCRVAPGNWKASDPVDVSPEQEMRVVAGGAPEVPLHQQGGALPGPEVTQGAGLVAFCEDIAGRRYDRAGRPALVAVRYR